MQCSVAREQFRRQCEFFEKSSDASAAAIQAKADGVEGAADHPGRAATTQAIGTFDQTDIAPGACPADRTLTIGSAVIALPLSQVCAPAQSLGALLIGLTALACVAIVFKGT